ncbi:MAG: AI-2E family transporter [Microbacteriaceae bacterium]|nr:AI-2E family transporter [Microbacteriaceae bacterium]MDR9443667.1 AI-2E family transporter [Microbacteriaceae bacterium]
MQISNLRLGNAFSLGLLGGLGVLLALLIGGAFATTATIITYIAASLFIALGLDPMVNWIDKRGLPRWASVAVVAVGFVGLLTLLLVNIIPTVIREANNLILAAPDIVEGLIDLDVINEFDEQLGGVISTSLTEVADYLADTANWSEFLGGVLQVGLGILNGLFGFVIVVILTLYLMASLQQLKDFGYKMVPASRRERFTEITEQVVASVGKWVSAQVTVAFIHALAAFIFLSIIGAPFALLLASVSFILALIPLVGPITAAALVTLVSLTDSTATALTLVVYYLIYLQVEAYLISPRVMKKAVSVPAPIVVIAALLGGTLLGVLGALVAIPVAASVIIILREVWIPRQQMR